MSKKLKSKIDFKKPGKDAYDSQPISRLTYDETGQWAVPDPNFDFRAVIKKAKEKEMSTDNKDIQGDEYYLPGDLGNVTIGSTGEKRTITKFSVGKRTHTFTITLSQVVKDYLQTDLLKKQQFAQQVTEDAEFQVIDPKRIEDKSK